MSATVLSNDHLHHKLKILIVDDSKSIRYSLNFLLEENGYDVMEADNGSMALQLANSEKYDVVVTDINMPEMDGLTFTRELRQIPSYKFTTVLILTTENSEEMRIKGREAGATGWIVKPFVPEKLFAAIKKCVA